MNILFTQKTNRKEKKINPKKYKRLIRNERLRDVFHLFIFIIITFIIAGIIALYKTALPIYKETKNAMFDALSSMNSNTFYRAGNTNIYDTNDKIIGRIGNEKYQYVEISDISEYVLKGYIAKEDRNFSLHNGVDIKGTARATLAYIKNRGAITQGGSTITQQVIKNNLLTPEQTFTRKITEMFIAWELEKEYNKAQIMEFYCNSNYYGNGCYGIEGASQYYFGCSAKDLSLSQAAILVATSNSPNRYNPVVDYELSMEKKKSVLDDMMECKYITQEEYDVAVTDNPEIVQKSENIANENYMITYAIHCAALKLMEHNGFEFKYSFKSASEYTDYEKLYTSTYNSAVAEIRGGGYTIKTSLNPDIQNTLQKSVDNGLKDYTEKENGIYTLQGAAVCVDNKTGLVVAIVGGREGKGSYNRGYQAERQSGSSIKPLLDYGPAYNEGCYTPASILVDEEIDIDGYQPKNAWKGYVGEITSREALLRSYNTIAVKTYMKVTKPVAISYLDSMKFTSLTYSDMIAPALAVGGFTVGVTPVDMAKGYATIANQGEYVDNDCIISLVSYTGEEIYKSDDTSHEVYNADTAFMLTDILSGMFQENFMPGTKFKTTDQIYMGKTGTTNNNKDAWFCGSSVYYSMALWVGYDIPKEMEGVAGGNIPCKIWTDFMDTLHTDLQLKSTEFPIPDTIKLSSITGKLKDVEYTVDVYKSRPAGYDYVSMILEEKREKVIEKENEEEYERFVSQKVDDFEQFQITNIEEAQKLDKIYNEIFVLVDEIKDNDTRIELMERIAYKYDLLSGDLINEWNDAIKAYNKTLQAKVNEENMQEAELSFELAEEAKKNATISYVESYINAMNNLTGYNEVVETWIIMAQDGLTQCVDYAEYETLLQMFNDAVTKVRTLQMYGNMQNTIEIPQVPETQPEEQSPDVIIDENQDTEDIG